MYDDEDDRDHLPELPPEELAETGSDDIPAGTAEADLAADVPLAPPPGLPEKFWDAERGEVRIDQLVKSYTQLERRMGEHAAAVPADPDGYDIQGMGDVIASDPEVNARLHAAGFTKDQAQLVYDLAADYFFPLVAVLSQDAAHAVESNRLAEHFGGPEKWDEVREQLKTWSDAHLPPESRDALAGSAEGVLTLHRMMQSGEPALLGRDGGGVAPLSETSLRQMMQDPRYWRDRDPGYVRQVEAGFQQLYPE